MLHNKTCLRLVGCKVSTIKGSSDVLGDIASHKSNFSLAKLVLELPQSYPLTGENHIDVLWRTMVTNKEFGHPRM